MKNSIESIWKKDFSNENNLVKPQINDLYNQKSNHLVDKIKRKFRVNLIITILAALLIPILYYFINAIWFGIGLSTLLTFTAWYSNQQIKAIDNLNQGSNSYDYLKSFHQWLKKVLLKNENVFRYSYTLYFLITMITILIAWSKQEDLIIKVAQKYPDLIFIGKIPLVALIVAIIGTSLMFFFSRRIYRWDVRLVYGRIFDKLEETINEIEEYRKED